MNKRIFKFTINEKTYYEDPLDLERRIHVQFDTIDVETVLTNFFGPPFLANLDPETGTAKDEDGNIYQKDAVEFALRKRDEAIAELAPLLYDAFKFKPIDRETGEGITLGEILDVYNQFLVFQNDLKKNIESEPKTPLSTDLPATNPTSTSAGFGGIESELSP